MTNTNERMQPEALDAKAHAQASIDAGEWFPASDPKDGQFRLTADGVFHMDVGGTERRICDYLRVVGQCHDEAFGGDGLIVEYANRYAPRGKRLRKQIPIGLTYSANALHSALEGDCLTININPPRNGMSLLCKYLRSFPRAGVPEVLSVSMGGWLDSEDTPFSTFILRGECLTNGKGKAAILDEQDGEGFRLVSRGTLEGWQRTIAANARYSRRVMFAICASFAAPLLPLLGGSNVMYHFYGESSTGKSTGLYAAGSVWGRAKDVRSVWDKTKNNLETKAIQFNHLPLIVDELKQIDKWTAQNIAYALGNGVERGRNQRGGKAAKSREWLTLGLSAGEVTLSEVREGKGVATGESVRFVEIPALAGAYGVFESLPAKVLEYEAQNYDTDKETRLLERVKWVQGFEDSANAGAAGREWIIRLLRHFDTFPDGAKGFMTEARAAIDAYSRRPEWSRLTRTQWRVFYGFARVAYAGRLAASLGLLPWSADEIDAAVRTCFNAWRDSEQTTEAQRDRFVEALENDPFSLRDNYSAYDNGGRFAGTGRTPSGEQGGAAGTLVYKMRDGVEVTIAQIYTSEQAERAFRRTGGGLSVRECQSELDKRGRLYMNEKGRRTYHHPSNARQIFGMIAGHRYLVVVPNRIQPDEVRDTFKAAGL